MSSWDVRKVKDMSSLLSFSSIDDITALKNWKTDSLTTMYNMFSYCADLIDATPLGYWNTSNVTTLTDTFTGCTKLADIHTFNMWDVRNLTSLK